MKALIAIAALTISFSAFADHHKDHKAPGAKAKKGMEAAKPAAMPTDATDCAALKTKAEKEACMKAKKEDAGHM